MVGIGTGKHFYLFYVDLKLNDYNMMLLLSKFAVNIFFSDKGKKFSRKNNKIIYFHFNYKTKHNS